MYTLRVITGDGKLTQKISAIKGLRMLTGAGLKDAKEFVEQAQDAFPQPIQVDLESTGDHAKLVEGKALVAEAGLAAADIGDPRRTDVFDGLRALTRLAVEKQQYGLADRLLTILQQEDV